MGLDGIELILAIEEDFQMAIPDEEASRSETPAILTEIIYSKLRKSALEVCHSQHGFYRVRKYLMDKRPWTTCARKVDRSGEIPYSSESVQNRLFHTRQRVGGLGRKGWP